MVTVELARARVMVSLNAGASQLRHSLWNFGWG
jgi:hypothetical protein